MQLGPRLHTLAGFVPQGAIVADIGTDHAYLPIALIKAQQAAAAVAGDVHAGPYQAACEAVQRAGLDKQIAVRLGNGLAVLTPGEVDVVVIAGMGGNTMIEILEAQPAVTQGLTRLILQPMQAAASLRRWLVQHQWRLVAETLVEEDERLYEIIVAEPGEPVLPAEDVLYEIGPLLWNEQPPLLQKHLAQLTDHTRRIIGEMTRSPQAVLSARYQAYNEKLQALEAKQTCLLNAKQL